MITLPLKLLRPLKVQNKKDKNMEKNIKFRKVRVKFGFKVTYTWKGRKKDFLFNVSLGNKNADYYTTVSHITKDIRFNSLWSNITFATIQDAFDWCDNFESKNYACLGADALVAPTPVTPSITPPTSQDQ